MTYVWGIIIGLAQVALGPQLKFWGGVGAFLPAFIILAASSGHTKLWFTGWLALVITMFFSPLSLATLGLLLAVSALAFIVLNRAINYDNPIIFGFIASLCIALFVVSDTVWAARSLPLHSILGTLILTLPLVVIWLIIRTSSGGYRA